MAWAEDTVGRRKYVVKVMDLSTHQLLPIELSNVENNIVWAGDNQTFFYIEKDPETLLGFRVRSHRLDSPNHKDVSQDPVVWTQEDESFYTQLYRTKDEKYLMIHTQSTVSTEVWYADANAARSISRYSWRASATMNTTSNTPTTTGWCARTSRRRTSASCRWPRAPRRIARSGGTSSPIATTPSSTPSMFAKIPDHRGTLGRPAQAAHPAVDGGHSAAKDVFVTADEPSYTMALDVNREFDSDKLRYTYTSMVTPRTTYDYAFATGERTLLKREPVLGGYDPANYSTEFGWATARDGTKVPVSIVYHKNTRVTARRRCCRSAMARTAPPTIRNSRTCIPRCWIAASWWPLRTSAAARKWAGPGTRTASC